MTVPPASPPFCVQCAENLRDARLERARSAAALRRLQLQSDLASAREAVLAAALLAAAPAHDAAEMAKLKHSLKTATDEIAQLEQTAAADQQRLAAQDADLKKLRATWWYRLFYRRGSGA